MLICVAGGKGGVGKTTLTALLAEQLASTGQPFDLVDSDPQGSLSRLAERTATLPEVEQALPQRFESLARRERLVLLDLPSGLGTLQFNAAMAAADLAILPTTPSLFDLDALRDCLMQVRRAQELRRGLPAVLVVPNRIQLRERLSKAFLKNISALGWPVGPYLKERSAYRRASGEGLEALPRSTRREAVKEVRELTEAVLRAAVANRRAA